MHAYYLPLLLALAGCGGGTSSSSDAAVDRVNLSDAPSSDDALSPGDDLAAPADLALGPDLAFPPDLEPNCAPSGNCIDGPPCGNRCCPAGEFCDLTKGQPTCMCGTNPTCGGGDHCARPGPVFPGACNSICCGVTGPCPR